MLIVSACDDRMSDIASVWEERVSRLGYDYVLYDLGGLGRGPRLELDHETFSPLDESRPGIFPGCLFKPALVRTACRAHPGELVVYLDIDAFPVARFDEVDDGTYDVGLTLRTDGDRSTSQYFRLMGMVNAGVMFFRSNTRVLEYTNRWEAATLSWRNDQRAINESLGMNTDYLWKERDGKWVFESDNEWAYMLHEPEQHDTVFKFWPSSTYNWYRKYKPGHEVKIVHCRGEKKALHLLDQY